MAKLTVKRYATPPEQRRGSYAAQTVFEPGKLPAESDPYMKSISASYHMPFGEPEIDALYRERGFVLETTDLATGLKGDPELPEPIVLKTVSTDAEEGVLQSTSTLVITDPVFAHSYAKNTGGHGIDVED